MKKGARESSFCIAGPSKGMWPVVDDVVENPDDEDEPKDIFHPFPRLGEKFPRVHLQAEYYAEGF